LPGFFLAVSKAATCGKRKTGSDGTQADRLVFSAGVCELLEGMFAKNETQPVGDFEFVRKSRFNQFALADPRKSTPGGRLTGA